MRRARTGARESLAAGFGLIVTITLIVLLIAKKLAGAVAEEIKGGEASWLLSLDRVLNTAVIPLLMAFAVIVFIKSKLCLVGFSAQPSYCKI